MWKPHCGRPRLRQRVFDSLDSLQGLAEWQSIFHAAMLYQYVLAAFVHFCASTLVLLCFPRGVRWGYAPQTCAKESSTLWTLFTLRRGCVDAYTRRHPGTRKDPPESNLCSGGSGCIAMLPIRTNVQTRAAPKRRGVGLTRAKRCGCRVQPCRGPTVERSIGTKPMSKAGESGASVKSPCSGSANFGSATRLNRS